MICYDLHTITRLSSGCIVNERLHIFNNFFVILDKVALDESDIVHSLTQNTRNKVLQETGYYESRVPKLPSVAEFNLDNIKCESTSTLRSWAAGIGDLI